MVYYEPYMAGKQQCLVMGKRRNFSAMLFLGQAKIQCYFIIELNEVAGRVLPVFQGKSQFYVRR
jgi:hypothetical protein